MIENYECFKLFLVIGSIAVFILLSIEYLNHRIIESLQIIIDSLHKRIEIKDRTIAILQAKLEDEKKLTKT